MPPSLHTSPTTTATPPTSSPPSSTATEPSIVSLKPHTASLSSTSASVSSDAEAREEHRAASGTAQDKQQYSGKHAWLHRLQSRSRKRSTSDGGEQEHGEEDEGERGSGEEEHYQARKVEHRYLPILSGLICPFSVLLDIPGLTEVWYVRTIGYNVVETQPNPVILDVGQAVSIAFGLIANIALITRFLERRPWLSTVIAIVALTIHDIINVIIVVTFGVVHRFNDGFTYGDAFWLTVASTVASLTCNVTLLIDFIRTKNFRANGSGLTPKQRSLVIAVMCLLCYIGLGSLCFSFLIPELTFIDSLYFTLCTISSVGFGDILPHSLGSRLFSFGYDVLGLVLLAFTIAIARETIIETFEASYRARRERLAERARERREERRKKRGERERVLRERVERGSEERDGGGVPCSREKVKRELDFHVEVEASGPIGKLWAMLKLGLRKAGLMRAYVPERRDVDSQSEVTGYDDGDGGASMHRTTSDSTIMSSMSQEEGFKTFKKQLESEQNKEFRVKISISLCLFFVFWFIGAMVFHLTEKWTYFEALWFCFIYFTTIGYGDFSPKTSAGRSFFIAWSIFGIANMTLLVSVLTETWSSRYKSSITSGTTRRTLRRLSRNPHQHAGDAMTKLLSLEGYDALDTSGDIDPSELGEKVVETVKGFHEHARYFMLGRTGDPPDRLRHLLDTATDFDDEVEKLANGSGGVGGIEAGMDTEAKHFLFMISYERQVEELLATLSSLPPLLSAHAAELSRMRTLNASLERALNSLSPQSTDKLDLNPFIKRPHGGFGDEGAEEELEDELDGPDGAKEEEDEKEAEEEQEEGSTAAEELGKAGNVLKRYHRGARGTDEDDGGAEETGRASQPAAHSPTSPPPPSSIAMRRVPTISFADSDIGEEGLGSKQRSVSSNGSTSRRRTGAKVTREDRRDL